MGDRFLQFENNVDNSKINFKKFNSTNDFYANYEFKSNTLNAIHINVGSIQKHWLSLLAYMNDFLEFLDIIVFTEINITKEEAVNFQMDHFDQYVRCRVKGNGGGIAVYVRDKFIVIPLCFELKECEHLCLNIKHIPLNFEFILSCLYRPPNKNIPIFLDDFTIFLNNDIIKNKKKIL